MRLPLIAGLLCAVAAADESTPTPLTKCATPAPPAVTQEVERLLASAAEHATHSDVCVDGSGQRATLKVLSVCKLSALQFSARYQLTISYEVGGECSPYPDCAQPPSPLTAQHTATLKFVGSPEGIRITLPSELPGLLFRTPLARKHSTGCYGDRAAFVARPIK